MERNDQKVSTQFGYELYRDHILPSILGNHESDILYWAGKELARKFPIFEIEEIQVFFREAGWGNLSLEKTSKDSAIYFLTETTSSISERKRSFQLEAGFIAEQYQKINGCLTECFGEENSKAKHIQFQVKWDLYSKIND